MLAVTGGYGQLWAVTGGHWRLRAVAGGYGRLLAVTGGHWRLWAVTGGHWRLRAVTGGYGRLRPVGMTGHREARDARGSRPVSRSRERFLPRTLQNPQRKFGGGGCTPTGFRLVGTPFGAHCRPRGASGGPFRGRWRSGSVRDVRPLRPSVPVAAGPTGGAESSEAPTANRESRFAILGPFWGCWCR